jgi:hypothetical protein
VCLSVCLSVYPSVHLYLFPSWSTGLAEKLTGPQLIRKFPAFYGTRRFITAFTRARHLSQSWARLIQSVPPSHLPQVHSDIILPSTPGSSKWSPFLRSPPPPQIVYASHLCLKHATCPAYPSFLHTFVYVRFQEPIYYSHTDVQISQFVLHIEIFKIILPSFAIAFTLHSPDDLVTVILFSG